MNAHGLWTFGTHWGPLVRAVYGVNDGILAARLHTTNLVQIGVEVYVPILKLSVTGMMEIRRVR